MQLFDILKSVGSTALQVAFPGTATAILTGVNALLPDDKQLPVTATGSDIDSAIASLPPEQRGAVLQQEFQVDIVRLEQSYSTVRAAIEADSSNPHSTRPKIAYETFQVVAVISLIVVGIWGASVLQDNVTMVAAIMNGWPFVAAILSPFIMWLNAYFGILRDESKNKLDAAGGFKASDKSMLSGLFGRK